MFNRVYAYLNCNDGDTGVLSATNEYVEHNDDPKHNYDVEHGNDSEHNDDPKHNDDTDTSDSDTNSQQCSTVEISHTVSSVADSKDKVHPLAKMNTLDCSTNKPPHTALHSAHTMPHGSSSKELVAQSFGVHPYAVVDLESVRNL